MHTLVEATDQVEGSPPIEEVEELEKVVFPGCGEILIIQDTKSQCMHLWNKNPHR